MRLLERAAFVAVFATMGKFFERALGLWPAVAVSLGVVALSVGLYVLLSQRRAS